MVNALMTGNNASDAPSVAKSYGDFVHEDLGYFTSDINNPFVKAARWISGKDAQDKDAYNTYLKNLDNLNEYKATQSARAWDEYLSNTQYQRGVADLRAAGLNPWLAVQSGLSGSSVPSSSKASYDYKSKSSEKKSDTGRNLALLLLAIGKIAASL